MGWLWYGSFSCLLAGKGEFPFPPVFSLSVDVVPGAFLPSSLAARVTFMVVLGRQSATNFLGGFRFSEGASLTVVSGRPVSSLDAKAVGTVSVASSKDLTVAFDSALMFTFMGVAMLDSLRSCLMFRSFPGCP